MLSWSRFRSRTRNATSNALRRLVSSTGLNAAQSDIIIAAITSQFPHTPQFSARIVDWQHAGLLRESVIKPALASVEKRLVLRKLGALSSTDVSRLREYLAAVLG